MKFKLFILFLLPMICNCQNYISFGGSILKPLTDVDYESGASLSLSYKHTVEYLIFKPTMSISMMSGIDNFDRRQRKYQYQSGMGTIGLELQNTGKVYGIVGIYYNGNLVDYKFVGQRIQSDKTAKHNLFASQYIGIGYHNILNYEFGLIFTNTNYLDGFYPEMSKHNDVYLKFTISYDIQMKDKCYCNY